MAKDPVCGMEVDPRRAAGRSNYRGTDYFFCSTSCKTQFDKNAGRFAK